MARDSRRHTGDRDADQRSAFQRDRDRIQYTSAFRRLAGVTQVVSAAEGHVFHNRLTHTLEVAQVGRRVAENLLRLDGAAATKALIDPDVVEAACFAHDLGHPPFGHIGEEELNVLVLQKGQTEGFEGNAQSFRIVTKLAIRHKELQGLNLTAATLNGILKYPRFRDVDGNVKQKYGAYRSESEDFEFAREGYRYNVMCPEAKIMDWADDVTYAVHDVEDFYRARLIPLDKLIIDESERERFMLWVFDRWKPNKADLLGDTEVLSKIFDGLVQTWPLKELYQGTRSQRAALRTVTASLIARYLHAMRFVGADIAPKPWALLETSLLKELVWYYVITNPALATQQHGQKRAIREVFQIYCGAARSGDLEVFPVHYRETISDGSEPDVARVVADLIASMTEDEFTSTYARLTGQTFGSITDYRVR